MNFPQSISLTITNRCNLRCQMCGQWSAEGYIHCHPERMKDEMGLGEWKRVIDELAEHQIHSLLIRGGEPFIFPGILDLVEYIHAKDIFISFDTNGTRIKEYAADLARIGGIHLTISLDGPEEIHDHVRGIQGTFARVREGLQTLAKAEQQTGNRISKSFNFTLSPYSLNGYGAVPLAARDLGFEVGCMVPYYYFPDSVGKAYEAELQTVFGCPAFSWVGFHHETSGVDLEIFQREHHLYQQNMAGLYDFPYMPLTEEQYRDWFSDAVTPVTPPRCTNVEKLMDIQPNGDANFCVDFIDYSIGNVRQTSIAEIWNSERANHFRAYRRAKQLPVCLRCGAKFMSEM